MKSSQKKGSIIQLDLFGGMLGQDMNLYENTPLNEKMLVTRL